jgi:hypothetical protein
MRQANCRGGTQEVSERRDHSLELDKGNETRELGKILAAEPAWVDLIVHEDVQIGSEKPFIDQYKKQLEEKGIPAWKPPF